MEMEVTRVDGITVLVPPGDLDMAAAEGLRRALAECLERGPTRVLLDLTRVSFLDSACLGAIVAAMKRARTAGGDVRLCAVHDDVRAVLETTRLVGVLSISATRQEAVASWA